VRTAAGRGRHRLIFALVVLLVAASMAVVFGLLFQRTAQYDTLVLSYEAERTASILIESYIRGSLTDETPLQALPESVVSFGIYGPEGLPELVVGEAPGRLRPTEPIDGPHVVRMGRNRIRLLRPLRVPVGGPRGPGGGMAPGGGSRRMMPTPESQEIALIDLDTSALLPELRARSYGLVAVFLITLILATLVVRAYLRLRRSELEAGRNARLAQLGAAARTLTHEIRNPLAAIRLQTAILRKELGPGHEETLSAINDEISRIGSLAEDVRQFLTSSPDRRERVDLGEAVRHVVTRLGYPVTFRIEPGEHPVCVDPGRLRSILGNILDNAMEAVAAPENARDGAPESPPPIEISVEARHRAVILSVTDSGPGIPPEVRDRVFDPFFTTKDSGSGIGLAIVRRFVEDAGGRVSLEDAPGGGTTVRIELPKGENCATTDS
jgi:signal transduction histidine kinase